MSEQSPPRLEASSAIPTFISRRACGHGYPSFARCASLALGPDQLEYLPLFDMRYHFWLPVLASR